MKCLNIVNVILVVCAGVAVYADESRSACCPDEGVIKRENNTYHCEYSEEVTRTAISLTCPPHNGMQWIVSDKRLKFRINEYDQLKISMKNRVDLTYEAGRFCVSNRTTFKSSRRVLVCYEKEVSNIGDEVNGYCMVASAVFLLLTALYYVIRKDVRDLQGKSVISLCCSLGMGFSILAAMKLISYTDMNWCAARGFFAYFFMIASFFWMNVLSLQILMNSRRPHNSNEEDKYFLWFSIYAWGSPALLTTMMAVVNFFPGSHLKPGLGLNHCWFYDHTQQWVYMYSVMALLIAVNICIFVYAQGALWSHAVSNDTKAVTQKFLTTVKLFIVMGMPWIFDMISSVAPKHFAWEIVDLLNTLQGVYIFIVLVIFPCISKREDTKEECAQYHSNIISSQPYKKFEC